MAPLGIGMEMRGLAIRVLSPNLTVLPAANAVPPAFVSAIGIAPRAILALEIGVGIRLRKPLPLRVAL